MGPGAAHTSACPPRTSGCSQRPRTRGQDYTRSRECTSNSQRCWTLAERIPDRDADACLLWGRGHCPRNPSPIHLIWGRNMLIPGIECSGARSPPRQGPSYPIPGKGLRPVLVDDADVPRGLDPGLSVHLHRHALITQDGDLHRATLQRPHSLLEHRADQEPHRARGPPCPTAHPAPQPAPQPTG